MVSLKVIIDRFEGDFAVVELDDLSTVNVPRIIFKGANEGDVVDIIINNEETSKRKNNINKIMDDLFI